MKIYNSAQILTAGTIETTTEPLSCEKVTSICLILLLIHTTRRIEHAIYCLSRLGFRLIEPLPNKFQITQKKKSMIQWARYNKHINNPHFNTKIMMVHLMWNHLSNHSPQLDDMNWPLENISRKLYKHQRDMFQHEQQSAQINFP